MSTIDRQRTAAVRKLERLGYTFAAGDWMHPANDITPVITDNLHSLLVKRADEFAGCAEASDEEGELAAAITDAIEAYEVVRWPSGKVPGGQG